MKIDAHNHFWHYQPQKHSWIDDEMANIRKDFLPKDLEIILKANEIDGCVAVQADQTETETDFLMQQAQENHFIKGIVGWTDLRSKNITKQLEQYQQHQIIKGFRHVLQAEDPDFMLQPDFLNGISHLESFGFTYDILIFPNHLESTLKLVKQFPNQLFVIDHLAKPYIKAGEMEQWKKDITLLAQYSNVFCKISGMVTEADYKLWQPKHFTPYIDAVVTAFGTKRILFGSDWPVCLVAATYQDMLQIVSDYFAPFSTTEKEDFFGNNAQSFYKL